MANDGSLIFDTEINTKGFKKGTSTLGGLAKSASGVAIKAFAGMATAVAGSIAAAFAGLNKIANDTRELREALALTDTAFENAGLSAEAAGETYEDFYAILGETDTAAEASQLLANLVTEEKDLAKWTTIATGVMGTFGDSLKVETLIESAKETAAVGKVTGALADALNWASISEDEFNLKLQALSTEQERNALITNTLNGEYANSAALYRENNAEIIRYNENQLAMSETMAGIGAAVEVVRNKFMELLLPMLQTASEHIIDFLEDINPEEVIGHVQKFIETFLALLPIIVAAKVGFEAYKIALVAMSIIDTVRKSTAAMTVAQYAFNLALSLNPITIIVGLIAGLVAAIVVLWTTNEDFRNFFIEAWTSIKTLFTDVIGWMGNKINEFATIAGDVVSTIWDTITQTDWLQLGKDIIWGIIDGIGSMGSAIWSAVKDVGNSIMDGFTSFFGISSPSKLTGDVIGEELPLGVPVGMKKTLPQAQRQMDAQMSSLVDGMRATVNAQNASFGRNYGSGSSPNNTTNSTAITFGDIILNGINPNNAQQTGRSIARAVESQMRNRGVAII